MPVRPTQQRVDEILASTQFKCSIAGEYKPKAAFSNTQWRDFEYKVRNDSRINSHNTKMRCREHSGEPNNEIRCQGPCNQVLPNTRFSKSTRVKQLNICYNCTSYNLIQDAEEKTTTQTQGASAAYGTALSDTSAISSQVQSSVSSVVGSTYAQSSMGGSRFSRGSHATRVIPPHLDSSSSRISVAGNSRAPFETDDGSIVPGDSSSQVAKPSLIPHLISGFSRVPSTVESATDDDKQSVISSKATMCISALASNASSVDPEDFLVPAPRPRPSRKAPSSALSSGGRWAKPRREASPAPEGDEADFMARSPQYDEDDGDDHLP